MSDEEFNLTEPVIEADDILKLEDPYFNNESVAIVTGAGSGIGQATTISLLYNNLTVVGLDIDSEGLSETEDIAKDLGINDGFVDKKVDLTDDEKLSDVIEESSGLGDIRFLANIAGLQHISSLKEFPMEKYDMLQNVMLRSPFLLSKLVYPYIEDTDDGIGAIGNMCSVHGHFATKDKPAYITTKFGLRGLTKAIAAQGNGKIRSYTVSVGYVLTPLMINQIKDTAEKRNITEKQVVEEVMLGQSRTKQMITPIEVANLFTFGYSQHSKHLNGGDLLWDGGYTTTYE